MRMALNGKFLVAGWLLSIDYPSHPARAQSNLFSQLVDAAKAEVEKWNGKLIIGLTWTDPQAKPVLESTTPPQAAGK